MLFYKCLLFPEDITAKITNYDCLLITGTSLAAQPSRDAVLYALDVAKKNNIPVILDIDYRPYTWESRYIAKEIYNKAAEKCSGIIGNDEVKNRLNLYQV